MLWNTLRFQFIVSIYYLFIFFCLLYSLSCLFFTPLFILPPFKNILHSHSGMTFLPSYQFPQQQKTAAFLHFLQSSLQSAFPRCAHVHSTIVFSRRVLTLAFWGCRFSPLNKQKCSLCVGVESVMEFTFCAKMRQCHVEQACAVC